MSPYAIKQQELDLELLQLIGMSPSLNALPREEFEVVVLKVSLLPLDKKLAFKDMLRDEIEDLQSADAAEMHEHYLKLKEMYKELKDAEKTLKSGVLKVQEAKSIQNDQLTIQALETKLNS